MGRKKIDDREVLLETAIVMLETGDTMFSRAYATAADRVGTVAHSEESARRRVQGKFNSQKGWWMHAAEEELKSRREEQAREAKLIRARMTERHRRLVEFAANYRTQQHPITAFIESLKMLENDPMRETREMLARLSESPLQRALAELKSKLT